MGNKVVDTRSFGNKAGFASISWKNWGISPIRPSENWVQRIMEAIRALSWTEVLFVESVPSAVAGKRRPEKV
jgi:hypothetical protein